MQKQNATLTWNKRNNQVKKSGCSSLLAFQTHGGLSSYQIYSNQLNFCAVIFNNNNHNTFLVTTKKSSQLCSWSLNCTVVFWDMIAQKLLKTNLIKKKRQHKKIIASVAATWNQFDMMQWELETKASVADLTWQTPQTGCGSLVGGRRLLVSLDLKKKNILKSLPYTRHVLGRIVPS